MMNDNRFKPAVARYVLLFLAGFIWLCVGSMLVAMAYTWLASAPRTIFWVFAGVGFVIALVVHHFGFLKIVDHNLERIMEKKGKQCLFGFISWKSYLIILVMVTLGIVLRHSGLPRQYLAIVYTAIGLALILSSVRYLRICFRELKKNQGP